ncbi:MAG: hypothetical protein J5871_06740 [Bacteroidales bacterium]|nr:hypothetical protein [Bacteroidales bacterium]
MKTMNIPDWTRLDNAAIIYPSCRTRKYAAMFRMSVTLDEDIRPDTLSAALQAMLRRFPSFRFTVQKGLFWWYLRRLENAPQPLPAIPLQPLDTARDGGYLFRIGYEGARIDLDVFHALTDGTGAMTFLLSLSAEYLRRCHGVAIPCGKWILDPAGDPTPEEWEDGFDHFSGRKGALDKERAAWHVPGTEEAPGVLHDLRAGIPLEGLQEQACVHDCTVTEYLSAVLLDALQELRARSGPRPRPFLRIELPVNLRPVFGRHTLRNFSSYVYLGLDMRNGAIPFADALRDVKFQKRLYTQPQRLVTRIAANVALEDNLAIRCIPVFVKRPVINFINWLKGDNYATYTFSNIGNIELPPEMAAHVRDLDFVLGRSRRRSGSCSCVSWNGKLNLHFTRKIREEEFEQLVLRRLSNAGLCAGISERTHVAAPGVAPVAPAMRPARSRRLSAFFCL